MEACEERDLLHAKYGEQYKKEGYDLKASLDIYVPIIQLAVEYSYEEEADIHVIEKFVCRCIDSGVRTLEDMSFVLALDKRLIKCVLDDLCRMDLLEENTGIFFFQEAGRELYQKGRRKLFASGEELFLFHTASGFIKPEEPGRQKERINQNAVLLEKRYEPDLDSGRLRSWLIDSIVDKYGTTRQIQRFELNRRPCIQYKKYDLMLYQNQTGDLKLLLYDLDEKQFDFAVSEYLQECYSGNHLKALSGIEAMLKQEQEQAEAYQKQTPIQYIMNKEIREITKRIFRIAHTSVVIVSPWLGTDEFVLTEDFLNSMEGALKRGIHVTILYGYLSQERLKRLIHKGTDGKYNKDIESERSAEKLRKRFSKYEGFRMTYRNTHEKILCCDDKFCIIGSFNYLSYDGGESSHYQGANFRKEGAVYIEQQEFVRNLVKKLLI